MIEGDKTFSGGLHVVGEVQSPVINGVDILHLNDNIVRQDKTATITKELVGLLQVTLDYSLFISSRLT